MQYEEKDILATPEIGATLVDFRTKYYQFRRLAEGLESRALPRIGQMVTVKFSQGWHLYYVYAVMRFGGVSKDQIVAGGNFLNYDITWDDAERVFGELARAQSVEHTGASYFEFPRRKKTLLLSSCPSELDDVHTGGSKLSTRCGSC